MYPLSKYLLLREGFQEYFIIEAITLNLISIASTTYFEAFLPKAPRQVPNIME